MTFRGKVAVVTGANSGIGYMTARYFAQRGALVVLAARRDSEGNAAAEEIVASGGRAIFVRTDVSKEKDVEVLIQTVLSSYGRLDYAFNNAGTAEMPVGVANLSESEWDRVLDINLKGTWLCMKHQIPAMIKSGGGSIVNMASVYGMTGTGMGIPAYVASKHGVLGLTKAAALEYSKLNLRVNAVCPGWIPTPGNEAALEDKAISEFARGLHPMGRLGTQEEIAEAVMWLCSSGSSFMTGQPLVLDGGYTAQ